MKSPQQIAEEKYPIQMGYWFGTSEYFDSNKAEREAFIAGMKANEGLRGALEKIRDMVLTPEEAINNEYKYALNRTWHIATEALSNFKQDGNEKT